MQYLLVTYKSREWVSIRSKLIKLLDPNNDRFDLILIIKMVKRFQIEPYRNNFGSTMILSI